MGNFLRFWKSWRVGGREYAYVPGRCNCVHATKINYNDNENENDEDGDGEGDGDGDGDGDDNENVFKPLDPHSPTGNIYEDCAYTFLTL